MVQCMALTIELAASILFAAHWLRGRRAGFARLAIGMAVGLAVYFVLSVLWRRGAFLTALLSGQLACLVYDLVRRKRQAILPEACLYLGRAGVWLPLCLGQEAVWQYAVYLAALALCASLTPPGMDAEKSTLHRLTELRLQQRGYAWLVCLLPCAALVIEPLLLFAAGGPGLFSGLLLSAALFLLYGLALWLQREILRRMAAEALNRDLGQWQRESRDYMNTIRAQRHDFNLHLHAISGLISSGEYEQCRQYIQKLVSEAAAVNDIMPVSDAMVGSMLYNMREEARRRGSDIFYHITYDMDDILCNSFECNKIIGNLLQNAIDALQTPEDKAFGIRVSIFKRRGNTVITTENRFTGSFDAIARVFEPGYSTKKSHEGIGLSMVLRTVEQYGGRVYPEFEQDRLRFVVNIPNKVNLPGGGNVT